MPTRHVLQQQLQAVACRFKGTLSVLAKRTIVETPTATLKGTLKAILLGMFIGALIGALVVPLPSRSP